MAMISINYFSTKLPAFTRISPPEQLFYFGLRTFKAHSKTPDTKDFKKRPQFGNRYLTDKDKVFEHNAWDNIEWDENLLQEAKKKVENNSSKFVSEQRKEELEREAAQKWDKFCSIHDKRFFKDRKWIFTDFPELGETLLTQSDDDVANAAKAQHSNVIIANTSSFISKQSF